MTVDEAFRAAAQHRQFGQHESARHLCEQLVAVQPDHAGAWHLLGAIAHGQGQLETAAACISRAIELAPGIAEFHSNLGNCWQSLGQTEEAIAAYQRASALDPADPRAWYNLGLAQIRAGNGPEAVTAISRFLELEPRWPEAYRDLGLAHTLAGEMAQAIAAYRTALEIRPEFVDALNNLANLLKTEGRLDEAECYIRRALELQPRSGIFLANLGAILKNQGRAAEATSAYQQAILYASESARIRSGLIYASLFNEEIDGAARAALRQGWDRTFGQVSAHRPRVTTTSQLSARRLRIGYVSPDFRDHVVGRNLLPLFRNHAHTRFEIVVYAHVARPDSMTAEFQKLADHWRPIVGLDDARLAELVASDQIDILVDLSQHMAGHRLGMFARRPAPFQVSFAGYPESTGLSAIEHRISDRHLESESSDSSSSRGERVHLLESFWCFDPLGAQVNPNALPAAEDGFVTFGNLNNFSKLNEPLFVLWARLLREVESSRLLLLATPGHHRERVWAVFEREGLSRDRIEFVPPRPREAYLALYHRVDVVLDSFPYNGHSTSLDALWMGVPVVTLVGPSGLSRAGLSQLTNLNAPELIAFSEHDYVRIAVDLARNFERLKDYRRTLRDRLEQSVLMDEPRFARQIEGIFAQIAFPFDSAR